MKQVEVEVHKNFESCEEELRDLINRDKSNNPFLDVDWLKLWWEHFGQEGSLYLMLFRQKGVIVGFVPFYRVNRPAWRLSEYRFLGHGTSNYLDIVCMPGFEEVLINALFSHFEVISTPSIVHFHDINDRFSRCYVSLSGRLAKSGRYSSAFKLYPCPVACLGDDWNSFFERQRSTKSRKNLRRAERQLSKIGRWHFREVTDPSELPRLVPELERLHGERFSETVNPLFYKENRSFFVSALSQFLGSHLSLSIIELDGVLVSFLIGLRMGGIFVDYAPAFDPALASLSLGQIHLMRLMEKKIAEGYKYFDFSKGEAPYKRWWSNEETTNYLFRFGFKLTRSGYIYAKWLDGVFKIILLMRERGYNARIKHWIARFRNRAVFTSHKNRVQIRKILASSIPSTVHLSDWSYQLIRDLPPAIRKAAIESLVRNKVGKIRAGVNPDKKAVILMPSDRDSGYCISY